MWVLRIQTQALMHCIVSEVPIASSRFMWLLPLNPSQRKLNFSMSFCGDIQTLPLCSLCNGQNHLALAVSGMFTCFHINLRLKCKVSSRIQPPPPNLEVTNSDHAVYFLDVEWTRMGHFHFNRRKQKMGDSQVQAGLRPSRLEAKLKTSPCSVCGYMGMQSWMCASI